MTARWLVGLSLVGTVAAGSLVARRNGDGARASRVDPELWQPAPGDALTVLAFTSPLCHACRRTAGLVAEALGVDEHELGRRPEGVGFAEVDVTANAALVEALDVTRTPTVVVLDHEGRVRLAREANPDPDELATALTPPVGI